MPLDFPSSPTNGQVYQNYYYDGPTGAWRSLSSTVNPIPSTLKNLTISSTETTGVSLRVTPFTTSSVNLQEWYNTSSTVVASMNVAGDLTANELNLTGTEINGDSKTIARYSDSWLRLNPDQDFTSGIYTNTSLIRTDNGLQVGANGANFLATSSALTHNGIDILKKDMRQYYSVGNVGTGTAANYYEIFTWTIGGQYNNFSAEIKVNGRGNTDAAYTVHARGEYGVAAWSTEILNVYSESALADGDTWLLVFSDAAKTAKLYYRRSGNDWNDRSINFISHWLGGATPVYSNTNFGTTAPTGDAVITKTAPDAISVVSGGTGATTFLDNVYIKGNGVLPFTGQSGIPAGDITSGSLAIARGGTGATTGAGGVPMVATSTAVNAGTASTSAEGVVTFSGVTTLGLNGIFNGNYEHYRVIVTNYAASSAGSNQSVQLRANNVTLTSGTYQWYGYRFVSWSNAAIAGNGSGSWYMMESISQSNAYYTSTMDFISPFNSAEYTRYVNSSYIYAAQYGTGISNGMIGTAASYDGLTFNFTAASSGKVRVYGYK